jgi:uncharacterized coiled-coil DUF342 family protein
MAEKVRIQKTVQERDTLSKVISKEFTTFTRELETPDTDSISELFRLYNKFYLDIPLEGNLSHTRLIEESSKLVTIQEDNDEIQPLLDEITNLRQNLLESNETIEELNNEIDKLRIN